MAIETRIVRGKQVFEHWEVQEFIGSGSGGKTAVFRLVSRHGEEASVLKVINILEEVGLKTELSEDYRKEYETERAELCRKAEHEIHLMSHLRGNAHIVEYFEYQFLDYEENNTFGTDLLIRMELLECLREERKKKGEYSEEEVIKIGKDICQGLSFCHQEGVIHRDIKPGNIFVTSGGEYKLGDFGIAKMVDEGQKASTKMGTRAYAAPEQFLSYKEKYDKRVDIYSLGLTLYELANHNRLPFAQSGYVRENEIRLRIIGEEFPAPENANPALAEVIKKACAYQVEHRYSSAEEMQEALMAAEVGVFVEEKVKGRGTEKKQRNRIVSAVAAVLLIFLLSTVFVRVYRKQNTDNADTVSGVIVNDYDAVSGAATDEDTLKGSENKTEQESKPAVDWGLVTSVAISEDSLEEENIAIINQEGRLYMVRGAAYGQAGYTEQELREKAEYIMGHTASVLISEKYCAALNVDGGLYFWNTTQTDEAGENWTQPARLLNDVKEIVMDGIYLGVLCKNGDFYILNLEQAENSGYEAEDFLIAEHVTDFSMDRGTKAMVTEDGSLYVWGADWDKRDEEEAKRTPVKLGLGEEVTDVCTYDGTVAAITASGKLYTWGNNAFETAGVGRGNRLIYEPVCILENVTNVSLGTRSGAAITEYGELYMWGRNEYGQLGLPINGITNQYSTPNRVCDEVAFVQLGYENTAIVKKNGDLFLCGSNDNHQVDDSHLLKIDSPVFAASNIESVAVGRDTIFAVDGDGKLYSWGE